MKVFLLLFLFYCMYPSKNLNIFAMMFSIALPMGVIGYDEKSKWDRLAAMMPYSTGSLVFTKYVLGYLNIVAVTAVSFLSQTVIAVVKGQPVTAEPLLGYLMMGSVTLTMLALLLPLIFRFGLEKARLIYMFVIIGGGVLGVQLIDNGSAVGSFFARLPMPELLLTAVALVVNVISVNLSMMAYRKRSF